MWSVIGFVIGLGVGGFVSAMVFGFLFTILGKIKESKQTPTGPVSLEVLCEAEPNVARIVERFGKLRRVVIGEWAALMPVLDAVVGFVKLDQFQSEYAIEAISKDGIKATIHLPVTYKCEEAAELYYRYPQKPGESDFNSGYLEFCRAAVAQYVFGQYTFDQWYTQRKQLAAVVHKLLTVFVKHYGYAVEHVDCVKVVAPEKLEDAITQKLREMQNAKVASANATIFKQNTVTEAKANFAAVMKRAKSMGQNYVALASNLADRYAARKEDQEHPKSDLEWFRDELVTAGVKAREKLLYAPNTKLVPASLGSGSEDKLGEIVRLMLTVNELKTGFGHAVTSGAGDSEEPFDFGDDVIELSPENGLRKMLS